ncbi:hypothetical protein A2U01_0104411, partial [Trifolium medium]|nr:hypothetical protein [Trifolium medium]
MRVVGGIGRLWGIGCLMPSTVRNKIAAIPTPTDANCRDEKASIGGNNPDYSIAV